MNNAMYGNEIDERAAPQSVRRNPAFKNSPSVHTFVYRHTHRGIRSRIALLRRALPKKCRTLPDIVPGKSGTRMSVNSNF